MATRSERLYLALYDPGNGSGSVRVVADGDTRHELEAAVSMDRHRVTIIRRGEIPPAASAAVARWDFAWREEEA